MKVKKYNVDLTPRQVNLITYALKMYGDSMYSLCNEYDLWDKSKSNEARHVMSECSKLWDKLALLKERENKL